MMDTDKSIETLQDAAAAAAKQEREAREEPDTTAYGMCFIGRHTNTDLIPGYAPQEISRLVSFSVPHEN